jgi:hypothetical protein
MNRISLCLFMAIKFVYFVLCHLGWGRVWTWVYDLPMTFMILLGRWVGNTGCPAKSSTKGGHRTGDTASSNHLIGHWNWSECGVRRQKVLATPKGWVGVRIKWQITVILTHPMVMKKISVICCLICILFWVCFYIMQSWVDGIRKAQELYAAAKQAISAANITASSSIPVTTTGGSISRQPSACYYEDDDLIDPTECQSCTSYGTNPVLIPSRSPRGDSSRGSRGSSLVHSHR